MPVVLYVDASDESSSTIHVSPQVADMLGYTPEEWLADSELWSKTLHPNDRERTTKAIARARRIGEPFGMEYRLLTRDGRVVWVRDEAAPIWDEENRNRRWQGILLDITERKRYEEELRESKERHRLVARVTGEAIWDNDLLTGRQEWDGATEALFGYPPHRSRTGAWWEKRIHPEDKERVLFGLDTMFEVGGEAWAEEYRFRRADGSYARVVDRGHVVCDGDGKPVRMVGSMADVTERREMEAVLKESEERFRTTFEAAAVGMAHVAPDNRWLRINGKFCEIVGFERDKLLETTFVDLTPEEDVEASLERVREILGGERGPYSLERRYVRKNGSVIWVSLNVSLARKATGEPDYLICAANDITSLKLAELIPDPLTEREMEVLHLIAEGQKNQQIARQLSHSLGTIKLDVRHIIAKLRVKDRKQAASRAIEVGLVSPPLH